MSLESLLKLCEKAESSDLNVNDILAMLCICKATPDDPATLGKIAAATNMSTAGATHLADRLEKIGMAARNRSHADRRIITLDLTAKGISTLELLALLAA